MVTRLPRFTASGLNLFLPSLFKALGRSQGCRCRKTGGLRAVSDWPNKRESHLNMSCPPPSPLFSYTSLTVHFRVPTPGPHSHLLTLTRVALAPATRNPRFFFLSFFLFCPPMISFHSIFIFHFLFSWHFTVFSCDVIAQTCILFHLISFVSLCYFSVIGFSIFHHHSHPITHTHTHPGQTRARGGSRIDRQTLHASMPSCSILRTVHKYTNIEVYCPSSGIVS